MSKFKRSMAMLGVAGILGALMALVAITPTPAGASLPDNTIDVRKIVSGTVPASTPAALRFLVEVQCAAVPALGLPPLTIAGVAFNQDGTPDSTNPLVIEGGYTDCGIREVQNLGADSSGIQGFGSPNTNVDFVGSGLNAAIPALITFPAGGGGAATIFVGNVFNPTTFNTVHIVKQTTGPVPADAVFEITTSCVAPAPIGNYSTTAIFVGGGGSKDVLVPSNCGPISTVETVADPPPSSSSINGNGNAANPYVFSFDPPPAAPNQERTVTVVNRYDGGPANRITIRKTVVGPVPAGATFGGAVVCTDAGPGPDVLRSWSFGSAGGSTVLEFPATVGNLLQGETCTSFELDTGGATSFATNVFPVVSGAVFLQTATVGQFAFSNSTGGNTATVEHVNRFIPGPTREITVTKNVTGTPPAGTIYIVRVQCNYDQDGPGPLGNTSFLAFGEGLDNSQSVQTVIPNPAIAGDNCTVEETNSGGAVSRSFAAGSTSAGTTITVAQDVPGNPGQADLAFATEVPENGTVVITNRFNAKPHPDNILRIKKQLRGRIAAGATFTIRVRCSGGGIIDERILTFSTNSFQEISIPYYRSNCVVVETANGGAQSVSYFASSATADATDGPNSGRVDFGTSTGGQRGKVIVRNQFPGTCPRPGPKFC